MEVTDRVWLYLYLLKNLRLASGSLFFDEEMPGSVNIGVIHHDPSHLRNTKKQAAQGRNPLIRPVCILIVLVDEVVEVGRLVLAGGILALHAYKRSCKEASALDVIVGQLIGVEADRDNRPVISIE